jgi:hypothetical protein
MRQVEQQLLALEQANARTLASLDSLPQPPLGIGQVPQAPRVPTATEIDSLVSRSIRAALRAIPPKPTR